MTEGGGTLEPHYTNHTDEALLYLYSNNNNKKSWFIYDYMK